ncbi:MULTISPECIES: DUF6817 domain-containing protein [Frankia]|uniref:DUF6817 domain-containing protein n=1 Tax=Frankia alni (strain DSM 45986 / CECT 9034 / ACN14a) TaxID=326424 RepID=Q0RJD3_FRAAA|nr:MULTISPECIES: hypothetical protein [Frankia]CAJ62379.1 hypothetical protein FRAAL3736 [Frankia alni ACN14a]
MIGDCLGDDDPTAIRAQGLLLSWGADRIDHPGGTLFDHLLRVRDLLARWRAASVLQVAGLCHAVYGTDGFAPHLVDLSRRREVATMAGTDVEKVITGMPAAIAPGSTLACPPRRRSSSATGSPARCSRSAVASYGRSWNSPPPTNSTSPGTTRRSPRRSVPVCAPCSPARVRS